MKYSTYLEYFLDLKNTFRSGYDHIEPEKEIDKDFEKSFLSNLLECVKKAWSDHEIMIRDTYLLTEEELETVWNSSKNELLDNTMIKLLEIGYIQTAVNKNGEIVYSITEDGREYIESI